MEYPPGTPVVGVAPSTGVGVAFFSSAGGVVGRLVIVTVTVVEGFSRFPLSSRMLGITSCRRTAFCCAQAQRSTAASRRTAANAVRRRHGAHTRRSRFQSVPMPVYEASLVRVRFLKFVSSHIFPAQTRANSAPTRGKPREPGAIQQKHAQNRRNRNDSFSIAQFRRPFNLRTISGEEAFLLFKISQGEDFYLS